MKLATSLHFLLVLIFISFNSNLKAQKLNRVQGEVLVQLKPDTDARTWMNTKKVFNGKESKIDLRKKISDPVNIYAFTFDWTQINETAFLRAVRSDAAVLNAQFNHLVQLRETIPNDAQFDQQWQYINTGQGGGTPGADIDADLAWDTATGGLTPDGDTIVVCIIDGGYSITHEDLRDNVWFNYAEIPNNGIDDDNNGFVDDFKGWNTGANNDDIDQGVPTGHGTPVAGIVGAKGNNGVGVAGVNWDVKLMLVSGGSGVESEVIEAYSYPLVARQKYNETDGAEGAFVVSTNASWGVDGGQPEDAPIWCAFYDTLGTHGILNCGATINGNQNVDTFGDLPTACSSDFMISVTNMNRNDVKVTQAGYGLETIDLGAFGAETWTAATPNGYGPFGGTSGATPHVTGTIALLYSAPCPNLIQLAKADPMAAASLVRSYILEGVDPNESLDGITVTGGRLNMAKSIQLVMDNCGPCPPPSGLKVDSLLDVSTDLLWVSTDSALVDTLLWRPLGDTVWNVVPDATSPYRLDSLLACTEYEFQVYSECDTISSDSSRIFQFKTDGCCEAPTTLNLSNINEDSVTVSWGSILAAEFYNLQIRPVGDTSAWLDNVASADSILISGLDPCTEYELRIQTLCLSDTTFFGETLTFRTKGCGPCTDLEFCPAPELNGSEEWIGSISVGDLNNSSGSDDAYGDFTDPSGEVTLFLTNNSYPVTLTPEFAGQTYSEQFKIWIDFNQNGDFSDPGEEVFASPNSSEPAVGNIAIPDEALYGITRMRIAMFWESAPDPCVPPALGNDFGEVEDYCIEIQEGVAPCLVPMNLDTTMVGTNEVAMAWEALANATAYTFRYRLTTETDWTEMESNTNTLLLSDLVDCQEYEAQVKSVCPTDSSAYSQSTIFNTDCFVSSSNIDPTLQAIEVFPNPVKSNLVINLPAFIEETQLEISVLNQLGQTVQTQLLTSGLRTAQQINLDLQDLPSGLYFIKFQNSEGKSMAKRIIKNAN